MDKHSTIIASISFFIVGVIWGPGIYNYIFASRIKAHEEEIIIRTITECASAQMLIPRDDISCSITKNGYSCFQKSNPKNYYLLWRE